MDGMDGAETSKTASSTPEGFIRSDGKYAYYEPKKCDAPGTRDKDMPEAHPVEIAPKEIFKSEAERRMMIGIPEYLYDLEVTEIDFSEKGPIAKLPGKFPLAQQQNLAHTGADVVKMNKYLVGPVPPFKNPNLEDPDGIKGEGIVWKLLDEVQQADDHFVEPTEMQDTHDHLEIQRKVIAGPVLRFLDAAAIYAKFAYYVFQTLSPDSVRSEEDIAKGKNAHYQVPLYHKDLTIDLLFQIKELKQQYKADRLYYWHGPKRQIKMVLVSLRQGVELSARSMLAGREDGLKGQKAKDQQADDEKQKKKPMLQKN